ncbi:MAG: aldehyde dehydrogenase family protein [Bdellovibrionales bacterium]|nr:aldehyde dehydrogenase family protein [Bdellovibrionales bacterium]
MELDFSAVIASLQKIGKFSPESKKIPAAQRIATLENFERLLTDHHDPLSLHYDQSLGSENFDLEWDEAEYAISILKKVLSEDKTLPVGPVVVFGSFSSPLLRFCETVLSALAIGNTVLLHHYGDHQAYEALRDLAYQAGFAEDSLKVLAVKDEDLLEVIYTHPSVRAVHVEGPLTETSRLKKYLREENKLYKTNFGSRNPLIFLYDAPTTDLKDLLKESLNYTYRAEMRWNRWFVQEKNYATFRELVQSLLPEVIAENPSFTTGEFSANYAEQFQTLKKESPQWSQLSSPGLETAFHLDFNNCSPWQQKETIGPVLTLTRFKNSAEAIKFANTTYYADSACVFSSTDEKSQELADQLIMPNISINSLYHRDFTNPHITLFETGNGNRQTDFEFFNFKA